MVFCVLLALAVDGKAPLRTSISLDNAWRFSLGDAADMTADFTHGTEYFTYLAKVRSADHSHSPAMPGFDDSGWQTVTLPHDWVVDLPYSGEASHSHGYKCVGWRYPANSVGWYRRHLELPQRPEGSRVLIEFEGIFRNSEVFFNGIWIGGEKSGYVSHIYDVTEYVNQDGDNILAVRADASTEEGWYYEGAGIYRDVWLHIVPQLAVAPYGIAVGTASVSEHEAVLNTSARITSQALDGVAQIVVTQVLMDGENEVARSSSQTAAVAAMGEARLDFTIRCAEPVLWSPERPHLYELVTQVQSGGSLVDEQRTRIGIRSVEFDPQHGLLINGVRTKMHGCDLHLDAAGVGTAVPRELWRYRLQILKQFGFNTIRSSHNPASPAMLDLCDEMGFLVIDENRLMGTGEAQLSVLRNMIERDRNHASVVLWSVGNEEWSIEWTPVGRAVAERMCAYAHSIDPTRCVTYGSSGGQQPNYGVDVFGYNYIVQNPIERNHVQWADHCALGTEETTGCGTRGKYVTTPENGWMLSLNRQGVAPDGNNASDAQMPRTSGGLVRDVIERGWRYYAEREWLAGMCWWTGFDYRGEANPMVWPATGSQYGLFDYCGYPKDEAWYLLSQWTGEPMAHVSPHWNLSDAEVEALKGEDGLIDVVVYSNCDEVSLHLNGRSLGRRAVPAYGHAAWRIAYKPGRMTVRGYRGGKCVFTRECGTTGAAEGLSMTAHKMTLAPDGQDVAVIDIVALDALGREVPNAALPFELSVEGADLLGWGNGDPGFKAVERPISGNALEMCTFSGRAQAIIRSREGSSGEVKVRAGEYASLILNY